MSKAKLMLGNAVEIRFIFRRILGPLVLARVGISGTTAKSRQRKFVPSSHPGPFVVVATSRKGQTKVGTLACFDLL